MKHLKWLDVPPVWLALFVALAWVQVSHLPVGVFEHPLLDLLAGLLVGGGLLLIAVAAVQMRQNGTPILPHRHARILITNGVFARSRNPIYLGGAIVLLGVILQWNAWPSVILVPLFMWVITDRFIHEEERVLQADFGPQWTAWSARTRRWL